MVNVYHIKGFRYEIPVSIAVCNTNYLENNFEDRNEIDGDGVVGEKHATSAYGMLLLVSDRSLPCRAWCDGRDSGQLRRRLSLFINNFLFDFISK